MFENIVNVPLKASSRTICQFEHVSASSSELVYFTTPQLFHMYEAKIHSVGCFITVLSGVAVSLRVGIGCLSQPAYMRLTIFREAGACFPTFVWRSLIPPYMCLGVVEPPILIILYGCTHGCTDEGRGSDHRLWRVSVAVTFLFTKRFFSGAL